jgi:serine/threonine-protein kinase RsbW
MTNDVITLTVPARGEYAKSVRMTAAELASRIGMSYDEVDDVRMAADEAFVFAAGCLDETASITFEFEVTGDGLAISVGPFPYSAEYAEGAAPGGYAAFILESVCDEFSLERGENTCTLRAVRRVALRSGDAGA